MLARKPGALRNGEPFRDWDLSTGIAEIRERLKSHTDGDRQFVEILSAVPGAGLDAVEAACRAALSMRLSDRGVPRPASSGSRLQPPASALTQTDGSGVRLTAARMSVAGLVHTKGLARRLCPAM